MPKSVLFDKTHVLDKVTDLFWEKGYNGTSMQDLVDVSGLNRSSLYNSFGDKFSLFQRVLQHYQKKQNKEIAHKIEKAGSPKKALFNLFYKVVEEQKKGQPMRGCLMSNCTVELSNLDSQVKNIVTENKNKTVALFSQLIRKAQENYEIDQDKNPESLALYLFSSLQGLRVTSMIEPDIQGVIEETLKKL